MAIWVSGARPPVAGAHELAPDKIAQIERLVSAFMSAHHVPGLSVAIVADGEPSCSCGYGTADLENLVAARASTVYRNASIASR